MFDTHTHLQFSAYQGKVAEIVENATDAGIEKIVVVGTNLETSKKAAELAGKYVGLYSSVGIHPHHVFSYRHSEAGLESKTKTAETMSALEELLHHPKVIAIGETGLDRHIYKNTKYLNYQITDEFIKLQKLFFREQIKLAIKYKKTLIIHNRQAAAELLQILEANWDPFLENSSVFHCCEPDQKLLDFALKHKVFIGVDGDITYDQKKQEFIKITPLSSIVLETDSPYFVPEPLISGGITLNEPKNVKYIIAKVAEIKRTSTENVKMVSSNNSLALFNMH